MCCLKTYFYCINCSVFIWKKKWLFKIM